VNDFLEVLNPCSLFSVTLRLRDGIPHRTLRNFPKLRRLSISVASGHSIGVLPSELPSFIASFSLLCQFELHIPGVRLSSLKRTLPPHFSTPIVGLSYSFVCLREDAELDMALTDFVGREARAMLPNFSKALRFLDSISSTSFCEELIINLLQRFLFDETNLYWVLELLLSSAKIATRLFSTERGVWLIARIFKLYSTSDALESSQITPMPRASNATGNLDPIPLLIARLIWLLYCRLAGDLGWSSTHPQLMLSLSNFLKEDLTESLESIVDVPRFSTPLSTELDAALDRVRLERQLTIFQLICLLQFAVSIHPQNRRHSLHSSHLITRFICSSWWRELNKGAYERRILVPLNLVKGDARFCRALFRQGFVAEIESSLQKFAPMAHNNEVAAVAVGTSDARHPLRNSQQLAASAPPNILSFMTPFAAILRHVRHYAGQDHIEFVATLIALLPFTQEQEWTLAVSHLVSVLPHRSPSFHLCPFTRQSLQALRFLSHIQVITSMATHCAECRDSHFLVPSAPTHHTSGQIHDSTLSSSPPDLALPLSNLYDALAFMHETSALAVLELLTPWLALPTTNAISILSHFQERLGTSHPWAATDPIQIVRILCEKLFEEIDLCVDAAVPLRRLHTTSPLKHLVTNLLVPLCRSEIALEYFKDVSIERFLSRAMLSAGLLILFTPVILGLIRNYPRFLKAFTDTLIPLEVREHRHCVGKVGSRYEDCCFYPKRITHEHSITKRLIRPLSLVGCTLESFAKGEQPAQDSASVLLETLLIHMSHVVVSDPEHVTICSNTITEVIQ